MMRRYVAVWTIVALLCASRCSSRCPTAGLSLDLNQFAGKWFLVGGTPVNGKSLSKCGTFQVRKTSSSGFVAKYTALSRRDNTPVTFNIDGRVAGEIIGSWQLEGSTKVLGPFKHVVVSAEYGSHIVMVVCSEGESSSYLPRRKFSMIWSRERSPPTARVDELTTTLSGHLRADDDDDDDVLLADQENC